MHSQGHTLSLSRLAARRVLEIAEKPLSQAVRDKAALCLLDFLGCCMAARRTPWAPSLLRFIEARADRPEAYQWGLERPVSARSAAFGNAILGHSLLREDMHVTSGSHIGVLVIPAVLALCEREGLPGKSVISGITAGYEIAARLGTAVRSSGTFNRHFRPSGITGALGAAAGASAAAHLDEDRTVHSLGFAANFACGLNEWAWSGAQEIFVHAGMAAQSGFDAFDLARAGMRASEAILEGRDGLFAAYGCGEAAGSIFSGFDSSAPSILEVRHKPYAGCNFIQTAIAAALRSKQRIGRSSEIEALLIRTFPDAQTYPGCDYAGPFASIQQTKMSLQFSVAAALLYGPPDDAVYSKFDDPELIRLVKLCRIEIDPSLAAAFPVRQGAAVEVRLRNKKTLIESLDDVPWLDEGHVVDRFLAEASACGAASVGKQIAEAAYDFWYLDDSREFFALLPLVGSKAEQAPVH